MSTAQENRPQNDRLPFLDGLRAAAALYVVAHHAMLEFWGPDRGMPTGAFMHAVARLLSYGHLSVNIFIVLSGFCLGLPVAKAGGVLPGGLRAFFRRRAWRILPPYYLAMLLSLVLIATVVGERTGTHWDRSTVVTPFGVIGNALMLQDVLGGINGQINHCFWSIAVEWHIYLLFPVVVAGWRHFGVVRTSALWITAAIAGQILLRDTRLAGLYLHYIALFCLGALAARTCYSPGPRARALRERWPWGITALVFGAGAICACAVLPWGQWARNFAALDPVSGLATAAGLVFLTRSPSHPVARVLSTRPAVFLGEYSYSTYLIHAPLLQAAWLLAVRGLHLGQVSGFWFVMLAGMPVILLASYLFFLGCERPFIVRRRNTSWGKLGEPASVSA
ncbi:acyltransferase [Opitutaceae bacterium EW11]|nr:acyltransferase [Opitutaceae bacterium EW11]